MIKVPCHNCERRHDNCHSNCEDYAKYRGEIEKMREYIRGNDGDYVDYKMRTIEKRIKRRNEKNHS